MIHDLCLHPEYIEPIRQELQTSYEDFERTGRGLPLLDSFIKESARLTPVESSKLVSWVSSCFCITVFRICLLILLLVSVRRSALQPFSLSDGTKVAVGEWACAPAGAIYKYDKYYPSPETFSGFRFVEPASLPSSHAGATTAVKQPKPSKLTDVDYSFLMWGTGRMAW